MGQMVPKLGNKTIDFQSKTFMSAQIQENHICHIKNNDFQSKTKKTNGFLKFQPKSAK